MTKLTDVEVAKIMIGALTTDRCWSLDMYGLRSERGLCPIVEAYNSAAGVKSFNSAHSIWVGDAARWLGLPRRVTGKIVKEADDGR